MSRKALSWASNWTLRSLSSVASGVAGGALGVIRKVSAKRKPKMAASSALPLSGGLSYSWQGVRIGGPVLTVRLETGPYTRSGNF